jgi:hypothetical protein
LKVIDPPASISPNATVLFSASVVVAWFQIWLASVIFRLPPA